MPSALVGGDRKGKKKENKHWNLRPDLRQKQTHSQGFKPLVWRCLDGKIAIFSHTATALTQVSLQKSTVFNSPTEDFKGKSWFDFAGFFRGAFWWFLGAVAFAFLFCFGFFKLQDYFGHTNGYKGTQEALLMAASSSIMKWSHFPLETPKGSLSFVLQQNENSTFETSLFPILFPHCS